MKRLAITLIALIGFNAISEELPPLDWQELGKIHPWVYTEVEKDVPAVTPGENGNAPSDAIVLFDGSNLDAWEKTPFGEGVRMDRTAHFLKQYQAQDNHTNAPADWTVADGQLIAGAKKGAIASKQAFGDMQLHIEWNIPVLEDKHGQEYGNSGIFLMGLYEIQVLNSFENPTYANGQAGSLYKQHVPLVNASRKPGEWQSYDILFTAPRFSEKGNLLQAASVTILHNGVLIQNNAILQGPTVFIGEPYYVPHPGKLPIVLQDHDNPVKFRNIWVREL